MIINSLNHLYPYSYEEDFQCESEAQMEVPQRGLHCPTKHAGTAEAAACPKHVIMRQSGIWQTRK